VVFPELEGEDAFRDVGATLNLIVRLDPAVVIPGHGAVFTDVAAALARARGRLAAYEAEPARHATHAAKVLLKFKLLELQEVAEEEFLAWAENTPYFRVVQQRWFPEQAPSEWLGSLMADLIRSGAARAEGGMLSN
jgi:glyoxylase-like metal-dependent hydrolase (beta-lactamase superfamily II)